LIVTAAQFADSSAGLPRFGASETRPLTDRLQHIAQIWATSQHLLVVLAAEFAEGHEWVLAGSPTAAHWLAHAADVEACTAREWIRIGKKLHTLPAVAAAFGDRRLSYSKVRALTRLATPENETELVDLAMSVPAGELGAALAVWLNTNTTPQELDEYQRSRRSVKWRTDPDGIVTFTLRLQPLIAGILIALLTTIVMRSKPRPETGETWPTVAQQNADAIAEVLSNGAGRIVTEIVLHVRGDGCTLDDGTPITDSVIEQVAPASFLRALIHDADANPVDASNRRRHPTARQKRIVKERDRRCVDCGRTELLEYDHQPPHNQSGHTITTELQLRCSPCHQKNQTK
jgi:hypothetical protein